MFGFFFDCAASEAAKTLWPAEKLGNLTHFERGFLFKKLGFSTTTFVGDVNFFLNEMASCKSNAQTDVVSVAVWRKRPVDREQQVAATKRLQEVPLVY